MEDRPSVREFWEWLKRLPANFGKVGTGLYIVGFIALLVGFGLSQYGFFHQPVGAADKNIFDEGLTIIGLSLGVLSLGVGFIAVGATYKSSTAVKGFDSEGKKEEQLEVDLGEGTTLEKGAPGSDVDAIKGDLREIKESLGKIEKWQSDERRSNLYQFLCSVGFACTVAGATLAITTSDYRVQGVLLVMVGVIMCMFASPIASRGKKR